MKYKERLSGEKPREKMKDKGVLALSNGELLSILLRTGNKDESVEELSNKILKEIGSINKLENISITTLTKINGIGLSKASTILAAIELGKRVLRKTQKNSKLTNTISIFEYYKNEFIGETQEKFFVLLYDTKLNLIERKELYKGTTNKIIISPAEVFQNAIKEGATSIIIMHNHPSGDTTPSKEDEELTKRIIESGKILDIEVIDHIIISPTSYFSFYENSIKNNPFHKI